MAYAGSGARAARVVSMDEKTRKRIDELVADAPPFSEETKARLAVLLSPEPKYPPLSPAERERIAALLPLPPDQH